MLLKQNAADPARFSFETTMRKTLLSVLLSSAAAFSLSLSAQAASVEAYGLIDLGISYVRSDADIPGVSAKNRVSMENGSEFGSRWGLRGMEDLGSGFKAGFVLESGFKADDGTLDPSADKIFGREAHLDLYSPYGTVSMGLIPIFGSTLGANGLFRACEPLFANYTEGFSSGFATASRWTRVNNAMSYVTPTVSGLTGYAMYSFQMDSTDKGVEGRGGSSDRYAALALRWQTSAFEGIVVADTTMYGTARTGAAANSDDGVTVTIGGNYKLENGLKLLAYWQHFNHQELNAVIRGGVAKEGVLAFTNGAGYGFVDGWGASFGVHYPVAGGLVKGQIAYREMDNLAAVDFKRWTAAAAYDYPLSKRTDVYAMAGWSQEKMGVL